MLFFCSTIIILDSDELKKEKVKVMRNIIMKIIWISFGLMVYGGLRDFEYIADFAMVLFILSIIAYPLTNKKEE